MMGYDILVVGAAAVGALIIVLALAGLLHDVLRRGDR
jgi:hypothetical protein